MTFFLTGALALLLAACGGEEAPAGGAGGVGRGAARQAAPDTALVRSDDPELREMARRLLPDLARRSGLELREPVTISRRTREQLVDYLEAKLDQDLPPERAEAMTASYVLLGMLPEGFDLREILLALYTEQVAGFYDPDSTALFVLADQPPEGLETLLIHELVHAVQDQATNLDSLTAPERGNDRQVAAQAAIEGHATLVMLEHLTEQATGEPVDLSAIPDFVSQVRPALAGLRAQYPALSGAPRVIREGLLFPYLEGAGYVQSLWQSRDGRPAPFDRFLPRSTEQVLAAGRGADALEDDPTAVVLIPEDGAEPVYENGMGEMELRVFLEELTGDPPGAAALGWDGDRYALFRDSQGAASLAWVSVWDSTAARDAFLERIRPALPALPGPAEAAAVDLEGRPGLLLRIGTPPRVGASLDAAG